VASVLASDTYKLIGPSIGVAVFSAVCFFLPIICYLKTLKPINFNDVFFNRFYLIFIVFLDNFDRNGGWSELWLWILLFSQSKEGFIHRFWHLLPVIFRFCNAWSFLIYCGFFIMEVIFF